jgi:hypothetical protein
MLMLMPFLWWSYLVSSRAEDGQLNHTVHRGKAHAKPNSSLLDLNITLDCRNTVSYLGVRVGAQYIDAIDTVTLVVTCAPNPDTTTPSQQQTLVVPGTQFIPLTELIRTTVSLTDMYAVVPIAIACAMPTWSASIRAVVALSPHSDLWYEMCFTPPWNETWTSSDLTCHPDLHTTWTSTAPATDTTVAPKTEPTSTAAKAGIWTHRHTQNLFVLYGVISATVVCGCCLLVGSRLKHLSDAQLQLDTQQDHADMSCIQDVTTAAQSVNQCVY